MGMSTEGVLTVYLEFVGLSKRKSCQMGIENIDVGSSLKDSLFRLNSLLKNTLPLQAQQKAYFDTSS